MNSLATEIYKAAKANSLATIQRDWLTWENLNFTDPKTGRTTLEWITMNGSWDMLPEALLSQDVVAKYRGAKALTILHWAVCGQCESLVKFPRQWLTPANMQLHDDNGFTPLHWAALTGNLRFLPSRFLTPEYLTLPSRGDAPCTPIEIVVKQSRLEKVPLNVLSSLLSSTVDGIKIVELMPNSLFAVLKWEELQAAHGAQLDYWFEETDVRRRYEKGNTVLHWAAYAQQLNRIPRKHLQLENVVLANDEGVNILHVAAFRGGIAKLPIELVTRDTLLTRDVNGLTVFHHGASFLRQFLPNFLTRENLLLRDYSGRTVLHDAAGRLDQIPKGLIANVDFELTDARGDTTIHECAYCGCLAQVPDTVFSVRNLTAPGGYGIGALEFAATRMLGSDEQNRSILLPESFRDLPDAALWICRDVIMHGKKVIDYLSNEKRESLEARGHLKAKVTSQRDLLR